MIFVARHKQLGADDDYWIATAIPVNNNFPMALSTRIGIAGYIGIPTKVLTMQLRDEYNCITSRWNKFYAFTTEADCEMACQYLESLLISRKLRGEI